jgi:type II secretion system protein G
MMLETLKVTTSQIGKRGFTLIELLVVVVIIIIIAASVLAVVPGLSERANIKATRASLDRLEIAIEEYYIDNRDYPPSGIGTLTATLQPSGTTTKRYIEFKGYELVYNFSTEHDEIIDSFGNAFVYVKYPDDIQNPATNTYDLYSKGPDGVSSVGTDTDDINNWSR